MTVGRRRATAAGFLVVLLSSCAIHPPRFVSTSSRLIVVATDATGGRSERLSFFAAVSDEDGANDIEYLYVLHRDGELAWVLTADDWVRKEEGGTVWIGSNGLMAPDGSPNGGALPRGQYQAILVDLAGERDERTFAVSAPDTSTYRLPSVTVAGENVDVASPYPVNTAFFLDTAGNAVKTVPVSPGRTSLDRLWGDTTWRSGADYLVIYGLSPDAETGFFSWKARLPD